MSATFRICIALTVLTVLASGCTIPEFEHPLVAPHEAKPTPFLVGTFRLQNDKKSDFYLQIEPAGENYPEGFIKLVGGKSMEEIEETKTKQVALGFTHKVGDHFFLNMPIAKAKERNHKLKVWIEKWKPEKLAHYQIYGIEKNQNGFTFQFLTNSFFEQSIQSKKKLSGRINERPLPGETDEDFKTDKTAYITSETKELVIFFEENINNGLLEEKGLKFERVKMKPNQ